MKQTSTLEVITDMFNPEKIVVHPNDGYDLKLYNLTYSIKIYSNCSVEDFSNGCENCSIIDGHIFLSNDMTPGKVKFNKKQWEKIGKPNKVVLYYEDGKLLISAC
jgi:hypothetical protein